MAEKRQANTGSASALARYERAARNSYLLKRFEIDGAAGEGARAPSTNRLVPDQIDFGAKALATIAALSLLATIQATQDW